MLDSLDDADLLARYSEGRSDAAFGELVRRYIGLVYHAALRQVGDAPTAEDVTQRVFILLVRKAGSLLGHQTIAGWLHATTRFVAAEVRRAERRRRLREHEAYIMQDTVHAGPPEAAWAQLRPIIDETLGQLSESEREIVLLRFFANLPFAQIGARLSVSENAARMRVERAMERLRFLIGRRGITSTAVALGFALESQAATAAVVPAGLTASVTTAALTAGAIPVSATALATLTSFMSSMKISLGVGAAVLLATAIGVATYQYNVGRAESAELEKSRRALGEFFARQRDLDGKLLLAEQATADLRRQTEIARAAQSAAAAEAVAEQPDSTGWDPIAQGTIFMTQHPSVERSLEAYAKARAHFRYSAIYQSLGLRPDQIDEFQILLSRGIGMGASSSEGEYSNRWLSLMTKGPLPSSPEYSERMRALIGEDGMKKLSQYGRTEPARDLTVKVAGELWSTETPLTSQQADRLVEIFTQHRSWQAAMAGSQGPGYDWNAILAQTSSFLSGTQLAVLAGMKARDQFIQAINRKPPANAPANTSSVPLK